MSRRLNATCAAAAIIMIFLGADRAHATQSGVEANGSVAITGNPLSIVSESRREAGASITANERESSAPIEARSDDAAHKTQGAQAASPNESRPIGPPPSPTPIKTNASTEQSEVGVLGSIDPRSNDITRVVGALAIVIGLILLLRVVLRKSGGFLATSGSRPSGVVEILAKYPVGRGQNIVLLKVARRILLLHQTGSAMTTLSEFTDHEDVAGLLTRLEAGSADRDAERFRKTLTQFMAEHEAPPEKSVRSRRATMPLAETEIVDLTRNRRGFASMLGRRSGG